MENNESKVVNKSNNKFVIIILILSIIIIALATLLILNITKKVDKDNGVVNSAEKNNVTSTYRMTSNSLENFDLSFLKLENNQSNMIYSPISIKYALEMLADGSNGTTKQQISALIGDYKANKYSNSSNLSFANALFAKDTYRNSIKKEYNSMLTTKYNAEIIYDPFTSPNNINSWVNEKTLGLINNAVDNNSLKNDFILFNALAINMNWKYKLQAAATASKIPDMIYYVEYLHENYSTEITPLSEESYHSLNFNNSKQVKSVEIGASINNYDIVNTLGRDNIKKTITEEYKAFLAENNREETEEEINNNVEKFIDELDSNYKNIKISTDFELYTDDNVKVFAKDLKEYDGKNLQYIGIMPKEEELSSYIKNSTSANINNLINNLKEIKLENFESGKVTKITGYIPLFKFDYELKLTDDLKKLGVTDVFDESKADLSNITSDTNAYISETSHKSTIEFSNEGIRAAATTEGGGWGNLRSGFEHLYEVPVEVIDITFDKPYMFLIRDKSTGEIWFAGTVYEPINK